MSMLWSIVSTIQLKKVVIFNRSKSVYTKKIRKLITKNGYSDDDALVINLDEMKAGDTVLAHLYKLTGDTDLPKVFVEETYMGGYNDLKAAILSGQFKFITRDRGCIECTDDWRSNRFTDKLDILPTLPASSAVPLQTSSFSFKDKHMGIKPFFRKH
ncbi:hypothetical protein ACHWQZ_G015099 [Mnemiopsis leidyi]